MMYAEMYRGYNSRDSDSLGHLSVHCDQTSGKKQRRFENHHALIKQLVKGDEKLGKLLMLDRQLAVVFELENFREYRKPTLKILKGLKERVEFKRL